MIRWKFVAIRLAIVVAVFLLFRIAAGPVTQFFLVRSLQRASGAKVEIASTNVGLFPPRVQVRGLTIGDRRKELKNLIEVGDVALTIDGNALLRRRYEVSVAKLSGVRIGGGRTTSGRLEEVTKEESVEDRGTSALGALLHQLSTDAVGRGEEFLSGLQTVGEAKRIRGYWESEYGRLQLKAEEIEAEVRRLRDIAKTVNNPLRDLPVLQEAMQKSAAVKTELVSIKQRLDAMPARVRSDMAALRAAKERDKAAVLEMLPMDLGNANTIGPGLLRDIVESHLQQMREYVDSGRKVAELTVASPKVQRVRGETIPVGGDRGPAWCIRRCEVDGHLSIDSEPYKMVGVVENLSDGLSSRIGPLQARLRLEGTDMIRVDYVRHRKSPAQVGTDFRDVLKLHWPAIQSPLNRIGKPDELAVIVEGGPAELWVEVESCGESIRGRMVSHQPNASLQVLAKADWDSSILVDSLRTSLAEIDRVEVEATFAGTWRKMDLEIASNLSEKLGEGIRNAGKKMAEVARRRAEQEIEDQYQKQVGEIEGWIATQQGQARKLVARADEMVESLSKKAVAELGLPDAYLGRLRQSLQGTVR